jgi:hypothetical protein
MKPANRLLKELSANDVLISRCGNNLRINAPRGVLTEELVAEIRANKPALISMLHGVQDKKYRHNRPDRPDRPGCGEPVSEGAPECPLLAGWPSEASSLIRWFSETGQHLIPDGPFQLCLGITVTNPGQFREALLFDISLGPDFITNRNGKLEEDLRMLKAKFTSTPHTETEE